MQQEHRNVPPLPRLPAIDVVRGVAICGILSVNVISFGMGDDHLYSFPSDTSRTIVDWGLGMLERVFALFKFVALFSMLFGASIVLFTERAVAKGRKHPVLLSLWRNAVLLAIGLLHAWLWNGDVLVIYAVMAPLLIFVRRWPVWLLAVLSVGALVGSIASYLAAEAAVGPAGNGLGWIRTADATPDEAVEGLYFLGFVAGILHMMLLGIVLYRGGFLTGQLSERTYGITAVAGIGVGLVPAAGAMVLFARSDFGPEHTLTALAINAASMAPMACGYAATAIWASKKYAGGFIERLRCAGQMALTNYLTQTLLGVFVLGSIADDVDISRTGCAVFVVAVWALQLWWSKAWLSRFTQGPFEWLWRFATYGRKQPVVRGRAHG